MNEDNIDGAVKNGAGKIEGLAGDALGDPELKVRGETLKAEGRLQDAVGTVHEAIDKVAGRAKAAAVNVNSQASDVYEKVSRTAQSVASRVDPFVEDQPYAALAVAAAAGLLAGLLLASRGPKVIYVKPRA